MQIFIVLLYVLGVVIFGGLATIRKKEIEQRKLDERNKRQFERELKRGTLSFDDCCDLMTDRENKIVYMVDSGLYHITTSNGESYGTVKSSIATEIADGLGFTIIKM